MDGFSRTLDGVLSRIRAGDRGEHDAELRARINAAFARHYERLRALVAMELRSFSPQQVEDTVQETMAIAWRKLPEHEGPSFRAWLFGIARGVCVNVRRKRHEVLPGEDALFEASSEVASTYRLLRREERERLFLEAAARALDPVDQEIFYMRHMDELPREEIARLLRLADPDEVRVALQRGKRLLARELEDVLRRYGHGRSLLRSDGGGE